MKYSTVALLFLGLAQAIDLKSTTQTGVENALIEPCVYLDETQDELDYQMDMFSRTLDPRHWTNAVNVAKAIQKNTGKAPRLSVHTWELYDKAFSFDRVRRYGYVQENMDMLEHFEDNLNTNISNSVNMANFLRVARTVRANLNAKYHDGEFSDPGNTDPREAAEAPKTWANASV